MLKHGFTDLKLKILLTKKIKLGNMYSRALKLFIFIEKIKRG